MQLQYTLQSPMAGGAIPLFQSKIMVITRRYPLPIWFNLASRHETSSRDVGEE